MEATGRGEYDMTAFSTLNRNPPLLYTWPVLSMPLYAIGSDQPLTQKRLLPAMLNVLRIFDTHVSLLSVLCHINVQQLLTAGLASPHHDHRYQPHVLERPSVENPSKTRHPNHTPVASLVRSVLQLHRICWAGAFIDHWLVITHSILFTVCHLICKRLFD